VRVAGRQLLGIMVVAGLLLLTGETAQAQTALDRAAIHAEAQYYAISLPNASVVDVSEAVLGDALGLPFEIDETLTQEVSFRVDGLYAPADLVEAFSQQMAEAGVIVVQRPSAELWLIPQGKLTEAMASGAVPVMGIDPGDRSKTDEPANGSAVAKLAPPPRDAPSRSWAAFGWWALGWVSGLGTLYGAIRLRRRRTMPTSIRSGLAAPPPPGAADDLQIPNFSDPHRLALPLLEPGSQGSSTREASRAEP